MVVYWVYWAIPHFEPQQPPDAPQISRAGQLGWLELTTWAAVTLICLSTRRCPHEGHGGSSSPRTSSSNSWPQPGQVYS